MIWRALGAVVEQIDFVLDNVPAYEEGRWYRYGGWGCRMGLGRVWLYAKRKGGLL